ncbi:MAG: type II secretion system protein [Deltaproteobacteria bacterium]|nr:type II secretion system protein [Deltaproteobacteria bacterium]
MNCRRLLGQRGTTLLESLAALGLFAIAASAVGNLLVTQMRLENANLTRTTAIGYAEQELEDLRAMDYGDIASRTTTKTTGGTIYTVATTVQNDTPADNMKSINTVINWNDPSGSQTYALNAIYTAIKR